MPESPRERGDAPAGRSPSSGRSVAQRWREGRERLLIAWASATTSHPWLVLGASIAIAIACAALTIASLRFDPDRSRLIDPNLPWQQRYASYKRNFPHWDDAVVVVDLGAGADDARRAQGGRLLDALAARLKSDAEFSQITVGFPTREAPAGLLLSQPLRRIEERIAALARSAPVLVAEQPQDLFRLSLLSPSLEEPVRSELAGLLERLVAAGKGQAPADGVLGASPPVQRFESPSGRFLFAFASIAPRAQAGDANAPAETAADGARAIDALRRNVAAALRDTSDGAVPLSAGVTGVPVIEADEARQSVRDASRATALAFLLILGLLFAVYRGAWIPLLAIASLLIGVAWTFGYLTLAVGRLQLLSVVFAVILLGLGIDTAIHLIARLELVRPDHAHVPAAIRRSFTAVGPGVLTSAVTTAAAFAATVFNGFDGLAEMGLIAAGGVLLCAVSVMSCFPAALEVLPHPERGLRRRSGGESRPFMHGAVNIVDRRAPIFATAAVALSIVAAIVGLGVRYNPDLLRLLPDNVESARWERALSQDDEQSVWHALAPAPDEPTARALTERFRAVSRVADVEDAGALFPSDLEAKENALAALPDPGPLDAFDAAPPPDAAGLRAAGAMIADRFGAGDARLGAAAMALASLSDEGAARAIEAYRADRASLARTIAALRSAAPPTPNQLPLALRERWVGRDGSLLLRILPRRPDDCGQSVLSRGCLTPFAEQVLDASALSDGPTATGPAIQIFRSTQLIEGAYKRAALLAVIVVFLLLLLDFHSLLDALCALFPVAAGAALTAAIMRLAGVSLNFANMITLPLLAGIGVSAGVHAVHRWRQQPFDLPAGLAGGCGRSITLTIVTTIIGFASMLTAQHRGIQSLGLVMSVGLAMVWLATVFALPALLRLRTPTPTGAGPIDIDLSRIGAVPVSPTASEQPPALAPAGA